MKNHFLLFVEPFYQQLHVMASSCYSGRSREQLFPPTFFILLALFLLINLKQFNHSLSANHYKDVIILFAPFWILLKLQGIGDNCTELANSRRPVSESVTPEWVSTNPKAKGLYPILKVIFCVTGTVLGFFCAFKYWDTFPDMLASKKKKKKVSKCPFDTRLQAAP